MTAAIVATPQLHGRGLGVADRVGREEHAGAGKQIAVLREAAEQVRWLGRCLVTVLANLRALLRQVQHPAGQARAAGDVLRPDHALPGTSARPRRSGGADGPTDSMRPTISCPRMPGTGKARRPAQACTSEPQMLDKRTRTRIAPGAGGRSG